ncbi:hypothetical protein U14_00010 [Candidatus Moduliflexus flocculans]|uniref:Antitoxin n=1 Tax=Candidatus Moduliflexus flocculans TaxID=1499966 RepID=A0A0S6VUJ4_9BACT|nr:hypothetical protein U14_00010 [Candidatus Moduliflexus flocculans]
MTTIGLIEATSRLTQTCEHVYKTLEPVVITKKGLPFVRIDPIFSASMSSSSSDIWAQRQRFIERCGEFQIAFDAPSREPL